MKLRNARIFLAGLGAVFVPNAHFPMTTLGGAKFFAAVGDAEGLRRCLLAGIPKVTAVLGKERWAAGHQNMEGSLALAALGGFHAPREARTRRVDTGG